jgi:hypothetical protein
MSLLTWVPITDELSSLSALFQFRPLNVKENGLWVTLNDCRSILNFTVWSDFRSLVCFLLEYAWLCCTPESLYQSHVYSSDCDKVSNYFNSFLLVGGKIVSFYYSLQICLLNCLMLLLKVLAKLDHSSLPSSSLLGQLSFVYVLL